MTLSAGKRNRENLKLWDAQSSYALTDALSLLCSQKPARFDEGVEVAVRLGIDTRQSDQQVRGATLLPHGSGRQVIIAVFAAGDAAEAAQAAGADEVGLEDLAERVRKGDCNFDVVIATPAAMSVVGKLGTVLGPKGLMPNPKSGTVTPDVAQAVNNARQGQMRFRADRAGTIHGCVGRVSFTPEALQENILALMSDLNKLKPASSKGVYFKALSLSTSMGRGIRVDLGGLKL